MLQKYIIPLGMAVMLVVGGFYFCYQVSDEMMLKLMGYSNADIMNLKAVKPEIIGDLIELKNSTDPEIKYEEHVDLVMASHFEINRFKQYLSLTQQYPELTPNQIVFLDYINENILSPKLKTLGYSINTIENWFRVPEVLTYIKNEDEKGIEELLVFASQTGENIKKLTQYVMYKERFPSLSEEAVVRDVDYFEAELAITLNEKGYDESEIKKLYEQFSVSQLISMSETNLLPQQTFELITASQFNISQIQAYSEVYDIKENSSATYAIQYVKYPNVKNNFYQAITLTPTVDTLLLLVNQNYTLTSDYRPDDLVLLDVPLYHDGVETESNYLRKEAAEATKKLFEAATLEGHYELKVRGGYRSYETQQQYYDRFRWNKGTTYADKMSSRPGHSEHQTGLAIDITTDQLNSTFTEDFGQTVEGIWIKKNAHRFGFIIRYPKGRETEVGYSYEPWHLRYVGVDVAKEIYEKNWVLEDYILEYELLDKWGE